MRTACGRFSLSPIPYQGSKSAEGLDRLMGLSGVLISGINSETDTQLELQPLLKRCNEVLPSGRSPDERMPRGWHGMTKLDRELIEDGVSILWNQVKQMDVGQGRLAQLVAWDITRPTTYADGSKISALEHDRINRNWPVLLNSINHELIRAQRRLEIPARYIFATEINPKHWRNYKELYIHNHGIICNIWDKATGSYVLSQAVTDDIAKRAYSNFLGKEVDVKSCCKLTTINSVAGLASYQSKFRKVGKYLSKGSILLQEVRKELPACLSGMSWVSVDKETRQMARASVDKVQLQGDIKTFREVVEDLNRDHEMRTGRPLFSDPWQYVKDDVPYVASLIFNVLDTRNTGYAIRLLLDRLLDFEDEGFLR